MNPSILSYSVEGLKHKIEEIMSLGFTYDEVIAMFSTLKTMFTSTKEQIKNKMDFIESLGYSKEQVIKLIKNLPSIISASDDNIRDKVIYYDSIGLHNLVVFDPKQLIQSLNLSKARNNFYYAQGINITVDNYRKLFIGEKSFVKRYNKTNKEILKEYNKER